MKVLVATTDTQGARSNDYCFAEEGELVYFGTDCDQEEVDGPCGCRRAMAGAVSKKATTTMKVIEMTVTKAEYAELIRLALRDAGWIVPPTGEVSRAFNEALVKAMSEDLMELAKRFTVGAVVERRGHIYRQRKVSTADRSSKAGRGSG